MAEHPEDRAIKNSVSTMYPGGDATVGLNMFQMTRKQADAVEEALREHDIVPVDGSWSMMGEDNYSLHYRIGNQTKLSNLIEGVAGLDKAGMNFEGGTAGLKAALVEEGKNLPLYTMPKDNAITAHFNESKSDVRCEVSTLYDQVYLEVGGITHQEAKAATDMFNDMGLMGRDDYFMFNKHASFTVIVQNKAQAATLLEGISAMEKANIAFGHTVDAKDIARQVKKESRALPDFTM